MMMRYIVDETHHSVYCVEIIHTYLPVFLSYMLSILIEYNYKVQI